MNYLKKNQIEAYAGEASVLCALLEVALSSPNEKQDFLWTQDIVKKALNIIAVKVASIEITARSTETE